MSIEFPTNITNPSYPLGVEYENTSIMSNFENGYVQSRRKFTRSRRKFSLTWNKIKNEEYQIISDFIVNVAQFSANAFYWKNPVDNVVYFVRCTSYPKAEMQEIDLWNVSLEFTEV